MRRLVDGGCDMIQTIFDTQYSKVAITVVDEYFEKTGKERPPVYVQGMNHSTVQLQDFGDIHAETDNYYIAW